MGARTLSEVQLGLAEGFYRITKESPHRIVYEATPQQLRRASRQEARRYSVFLDLHDNEYFDDDMADYWDCVVGGYSMTAKAADEIDTEVEHLYI